MALQKQIIDVVRAMGANFSLHEKSISYEEVFSEVGLMPAIARRADQLCSLCLGYGLGVTFDEVEKSTLGVKAIFDDVTPDALRLLCIIDVVSELINANSNRNVTSLDELMYD